MTYKIIALPSELLKLCRLYFQNLYGYAQTSKLPSGKFRWLEEDEITSFDIDKIDLEGKYGYIVECDLKYPKKIHDLHSSLPLAPEILEINFEALSPYAKKSLIESDGQKKYKDIKLMATLEKRTNYVCHLKNLKLYVDLGMKLKKIHRVLKFRQKKLIAPYVEMCTLQRQKATNKFHGDLYKKLGNLNLKITLKNYLPDVGIEPTILFELNLKFNALTTRPIWLELRSIKTNNIFLFQ